MIKCEELLKLEAFRNIELIAGRKGLYRMITWPYPIHTEEIGEWVKGGELLLVSRYQSNIDNAALKKLLYLAIDYNLSGIIVEGGLGITKISDDIIELANLNEMPLFWTLNPVRFTDITKAVSSLIIQSDNSIGKGSIFLDKVFSEREAASAQVFEWAEIYNINLGKLHTTAIFSISSNDSANDDTNILPSIQRTIISLLNERHIPIVTKISGHSIIFMLSYPDLQSLSKIASYFEKMHNMIGEFYENEVIYLSFGRDYTDPSHIKNSLEDGLKAMKLLKSGALGRQITKYCEIGSYQLLFEIANEEEMLKFRDMMLKNVTEYDQKSNANLFLTLECYLDTNGSISKTSQKLIIHRNTLLYRLDKIKSISNFDLDDPIIRRDFLNAIMILKLYPYK